MSVNTSYDLASVDEIKSKFLDLTGLTDIRLVEERSGPEVFLGFQVAQDAPLYRRALAIIDREIGIESKFHGRLILKVSKEKYTLVSKETDLLKSLITRSLRVTSGQITEDLTVEFVPFRGGEEQTIIQPANHVILGRRGVGKSSLILLGVRRLAASGHQPVWLDLQPYRGRTDVGCIIEILREILHLASRREDGANQSLAEAIRNLNGTRFPQNITESEVQLVLPKVRQHIREFTTRSQTMLYVFLDDSHLFSP